MLEKTQRQATKGAKAGFKRRKDRLQKTQRQGTKGAKTGYKLQKAQRQQRKHTRAG